LLDNYGADGVRFGMLSSAAAGNDIIFDAPIGKDGVLNESKLCEQGRNFCNKMWNALRLIKSWELSEKALDAETAQVNQLAATWLEHKLNQTLAQVEVMFTEYRLSEALMTLYKFIWDDFCAWYLEMIKPAYEAPIDRQTLQQSIALFERMMTLLHPFMPFVTEEIWHQLRERAAGDDCVISKYPKAAAFDAVFIEKIERAKGLVTGVREIRNNNGLKQKELLKVFAQDTPSSRELLAMDGLLPMVVKMASLEFLQITSAEISNGVAFLVGNEKFYVELEQAIDVEEERKRLQKELEYYQGFVKSVQHKLSNEKFVSSAPAEVVNKEKQKLADGEMKMKNLAEELGKLG